MKTLTGTRKHGKAPRSPGSPGDWSYAGQESIALAKRRTLWSEKEDKFILNWVENNGSRFWGQLAQAINQEPGTRTIRTPKSCRLRWYNELSPCINRRPFSLIEEKFIVNEVACRGSKWSDISKAMEAAGFVGRTDNAIKNLYNVKLRKALARRGEDQEAGMSDGDNSGAKADGDPLAPTVGIAQGGGLLHATAPGMAQGGSTSTAPPDATHHQHLCLLLEAISHPLSAGPTNPGMPQANQCGLSLMASALAPTQASLGGGMGAGTGQGGHTGLALMTAPRGSSSESIARLHQGMQQGQQLYRAQDTAGVAAKLQQLQQGVGDVQGWVEPPVAMTKLAVWFASLQQPLDSAHLIPTTTASATTKPRYTAAACNSSGTCFPASCPALLEGAHSAHSPQMQQGAQGPPQGQGAGHSCHTASMLNQLKLNSGVLGSTVRTQRGGSGPCADPDRAHEIWALSLASRAAGSRPGPAATHAHVNACTQAAAGGGPPLRTNNANLMPTYTNPGGGAAMRHWGGDAACVSGDRPLLPPTNLLRGTAHNLLSVGHTTAATTAATTTTTTATTPRAQPGLLLADCLMPMGSEDAMLCAARDNGWNHGYDDSGPAPPQAWHQPPPRVPLPPSTGQLDLSCAVRLPQQGPGSGGWPCSLGLLTGFGGYEGVDPLTDPGAYQAPERGLTNERLPRSSTAPHLQLPPAPGCAPTTPNSLQLGSPSCLAAAPHHPHLMGLGVCGSVGAAPRGHRHSLRGHSLRGHSLAPMSAPTSLTSFGPGAPLLSAEGAGVGMVRDGTSLGGPCPITLAGTKHGEPFGGGRALKHQRMLACGLPSWHHTHHTQATALGGLSTSHISASCDMPGTSAFATVATGGAVSDTYPPAVALGGGQPPPTLVDELLGSWGCLARL